MDIDPLDNRSNLDSSPDLLNDPSNFPFFDPPFIEEMHALTGTTHTENMRHVIARIELLDLLYEDPQIIARIKTWGNDIGLIQAAEELASVLDSIAQCCGLAHRADIFRPEQDPEAMTTRDEAQDNELSQQVSQAFESYLKALHQSPLAAEAAVTYVRDELHLPWPWLGLELFMNLLVDAYGHALGIDISPAYRLDPDDPPVAPFSWMFETRPGETRSAAQRRFIEEADAAFAQIQALPDDAVHAPVGRLRKDLEDIVRRNTRWFYQHQIGKVPQNKLARTYHAERANEPDHDKEPPACSCRTNVRDGIREAKRVLGLTPFHF